MENGARAQLTSPPRPLAIWILGRDEWILQTRGSRRSKPRKKSPIDISVYTELGKDMTSTTKSLGFHAPRVEDAQYLGYTRHLYPHYEGTIFFCSP